MKKLKTILQYKYTFLILAILTLIFSLIITSLPIYKSKYNINDKDFTCTLNEYYIDGNKLELDLKCKEKILGTYYIKTKEEKEYYKNKLKIGITIKLNGDLSIPKNNTVPHLFNYKKYLYKERIYYLLNINEIKLTNKKISPLNKIKNYAYKRTENIKHNEYLYAYILGKTKYLNSEIINSYRENGISHLFALSGLHVTIFSLILKNILKKLKIKELKTYIIIFIFLIFFAFITGFSPSILRASLLSFLIGLNKYFKLNIKTESLLYLVFSLLVITNPFIIYNMSFILSFTTTYFIIISSKLINDKNYIKGLLKVSMISFISNIGLSIYYFNYINPLGIILNLIFVPFISFIIFPLSIIVYIFPIFQVILSSLTSILENMSLFLSKIPTKIYFSEISLVTCIIYYTLLLLLIKKQNKITYLLIIFLILYWKINPYFNANTRIYFLDVNQGDSILIITPHLKSTVLIDTGGKIKYKEESWKKRKKESSIIENTTIPLLRKLGIKKIDYLILTHGDADHAGEASNLINNFKVENIYINEGNINKIESTINNKIIIDFKTLKIDNIYLEYLNNKVFNNENDDSIVLIAKINNISLLLTGDASIKTEESILKTYKFNQIDILKVGHHGSKTSTSDSLLKYIKPKISIISSGLNNRYSHPHKEVVDKLNKYGTVYNTAYDGTIYIEINKKLNIKTYSP